MLKQIDNDATHLSVSTEAVTVYIQKIGSKEFLSLYTRGPVVINIMQDPVDGRMGEPHAD